MLQQTAWAQQMGAIFSNIHCTTHFTQHICIPLRLVFVHHRALHSHAAAVCILEQHLNIDNRTAGVSHVTRHRPRRPNPAPNSGTKSRLRFRSVPNSCSVPILQCTSKCKQKGQIANCVSRRIQKTTTASSVLCLVKRLVVSKGRVKGSAREKANSNHLRTRKTLAPATAASRESDKYLMI